MGTGISVTAGSVRRKAPLAAVNSVVSKALVLRSDPSENPRRSIDLTLKCYPFVVDKTTRIEWLRNSRKHGIRRGVSIAVGQAFAPGIMIRRQATLIAMSKSA